MFENELSQLEQNHLLRRPIVVESCDGPHVTINHKSVLLMCSNDYLGLASHPALQAAARQAMGDFGFGSGASPLISGTSAIHAELEERIARFKHYEAAQVFNSGYAANTGIIPALVQEHDSILSDSLNHASIIDGCRLSRAKVLIYDHRDMNHLETLLKKTSAAHRRLIVTDGVFSMDGDIAPLPDIVSLADKYQAMVMVDDAHATGVLGSTGRGTSEYFGLGDRVHVQMGTFGKALGSFGAYVAGTRSVIDYLTNRSRSYIFSTALPASICAASCAALEIVEKDPLLRTKLRENRDRFAAGLLAAGIGIGTSETPIIPFIIGDAEKALLASRRLYDLGVFATAIRPPTVPLGTARIRMTLMASHSEQDVDFAINAVLRCKEEGLIPCLPPAKSASS